MLADVRSTATTGHRLRPPSRRRLAWGSTTAIMAPFGGPLKRLVCREKPKGFEGPCPLGAAKDSSAFFSAYSSKYCHNGGMALRTGFSPERDHRTPFAPCCAQKPRRQAESGRKGAITHLLWGGDGLLCLRRLVALIHLLGCINSARRLNRPVCRRIEF